MSRSRYQRASQCQRPKKERYIKIKNKTKATRPRDQCLARDIAYTPRFCLNFSTRQQGRGGRSGEVGKWVCLAEEFCKQKFDISNRPVHLSRELKKTPSGVGVPKNQTTIQNHNATDLLPISWCIYLMHLAGIYAVRKLSIVGQHRDWRAKDFSQSPASRHFQLGNRPGHDPNWIMARGRTQ